MKGIVNRKANVCISLRCVSLNNENRNTITNIKSEIKNGIPEKRITGMYIEMINIKEYNKVIIYC